MIKPFASSLRIIEPYLFPEMNDYQSTVFYGALQKVAQLHGMSLQGRMPHLERTYDANDKGLKKCACLYCHKYRDKITYQDMKGMTDKEQDL